MYRDGEKEMKQKMMGLNGDEAAAYAIKQVNPDVVAAYPITPQTIIVERYSESMLLMVWLTLSLSRLNQSIVL
jgi:hypothetical protein